MDLIKDNFMKIIIIIIIIIQFLHCGIIFFLTLEYIKYCQLYNVLLTPVAFYMSMAKYETNE